MGKGIILELVWGLSILVVWVIEAAPEGSLVTHLPGFTAKKFPSKHHSGYIKIDEISSGKRLFYYFVSSERNPTADPVVLWLNGGPGCSSFDGFVYEHGPFNFEEGKPKGTLPTLHLNPYSWSKVSNIIYLDSPAGVGLSYSTNKTNYITGDLQTAYDTHIFLLRWFEEFPEFLQNPFYIAGESFAGIYVPTLASQIVKGLKSGAVPAINFKGYMVGNGVTDRKFDGNALVPFAHGMALISDAMFKEAETSCEGNYYKPQSETCFDKLFQIDLALEGLNMYDILEPCVHEQNAKESRKGKTNLPPSFEELGQTEKPLAVRKRMFGRAWPFRAPVRDGLVTLWSQLAFINSTSHVPCVDDEVATIWLNDQSVRVAIHAESESVAGSWELCNRRLTYFHDAGSMIPYHTNLTSQGYRALIFSGDHDMCVPYTGSQAWTSSLGYKIVDKWRPWFSNAQVAGYVLSFLPAAVLTLTAALSPADRQVLAYLISSAVNNHSGRRVSDHPPVNSCGCFRCYTSYWIRWDSSPNRQLIHEIIEAYEEKLAQTLTGKNKKERKKRSTGSGQCTGPEPSSNEEESRLATEMEAVGDGGDGGGGEEEAEKGSVRKFLSFIGERIWGR